MGRVTARRPVLRVDLGEGAAVARPDDLVVEEPLEIRIGGRAWAVTMRTPGHDFDLVAGFLVSEGVIGAVEELTGLRYCAGKDERGRNSYNVVDAVLAAGVAPPAASVQRSVYTTSSCGVCGKASLDAVTTTSRFPVHADPLRVDPAVLVALPDTLRAAQATFERTGGLHAAGLFSAGGELLTVREDVGRHNAVDKVIGAALRSGDLPLTGRVLVVSGRASFELVQKAAMAGVPLLAAVSAPSSLAVDLAVASGLTLAGFVRAPRLNLYSHPERVATADSGAVAGTVAPRPAAAAVSGPPR